MSSLSRVPIVVLTLVCSCASLFGGGSFFLDDIRGLLEQQPALWAHLQKTYEISDTGAADRIGRAQNARLNGVRVAPYLLRAKPRSTDGDFTLMLEVHAETTYLSADGKKVSIKRATDVKEQLKGVLIRELQPDEK